MAKPMSEPRGWPLTRGLFTIVDADTLVRLESLGRSWQAEMSANGYFASCNYKHGVIEYIVLASFNAG